jgi:hypothetical protein
VKPTRRVLVASGLCLASALTLPGCAAERSAQAQPGWARLWFPFRSSQVAEQDAQTQDESQSALASPAVPQQQWTPSEPSDSYYTPRSTEPITPPKAPPAVDPGYLSDDVDAGAQNTTGVKSPGNRPARLRDVFESFGKRPPNARPAIPLDEPVASRRSPSTTRVVGFEQAEPVLLGTPEFVE